MEMCVPFAGFSSSGPFRLVTFDPIFREKVVEIKRAHPTENFPLGFDAYHSLQLSTDRFFRVTGKQPRSLLAGTKERVHVHNVFP